MIRTGPVLLLACGLAAAEPVPLEIDESVEGMVDARYIRNVHLELKARSDDPAAIRSAVDKALAGAKGGPWQVLDEGEGFVVAKMQYRDNTMTLRVEFNTEWVQLKYVDATNQYVCKNVVGDGVCYNNYRDYYGFAQNLRGSINRELKKL